MAEFPHQSVAQQAAHRASQTRIACDAPGRHQEDAPSGNCVERRDKPFLDTAGPPMDLRRIRVPKHFAVWLGHG
jgi:hypothetical protein